MIDEAETDCSRAGWKFSRWCKPSISEVGGLLTQLLRLSKRTELYAYKVYILLNANYTSTKWIWKNKNKKTTQLLYDPATAILGIYPRERKTYVYTKTCTWMLIVDLHAIIKNCNQFRCPLIGESLNKLGYIHTMEYYSARKSNELLICTTWLNFQRIMLSKSQFKEYTLYNSIYMTSLK